jgi:hypothetical protein
MTATISDVTVEPFQKDGDNVRTAVLHFHVNVIKPLVVNKTNYVILAHAFGPNTDTWIGKQIVVCPSMTPLKGKMVETIRIEPLLTQAVSAGVGRTTLHVRGNRPDGGGGVEASRRQEGHRRCLCAAERRNPEVLVIMGQRSGERFLAGTFFI